VPVATFTMLTMLLFNSRTLSLIMAFGSSVLVCLILGSDLQMMITFFLGSLTGAYAVRDARRRSQIFFAGIYVSIIQVICLFLAHPYFNDFMTKDFIHFQLMPVALNGILSAFIVAATLKIFEILFGVLTNFSLLELADREHPLIKRMILEAPGTYHHSLIVANLAEAAAQEIGAHPLLTRVGAYYHDVGKLVMPKYFTENQLTGGNVHEAIEPSMSRLVILNHVKEGMELAHKHKLNQAIIDFIPQHHGTGLMYYFYKKSLEQAGEDEKIDEADFRYPGPKPQTRETALVMLADSVEGATRALQDPNPQNIEDTVKKIVNNKFIDGQLDECPLTLKEIEKISSTFIRMQTAMYHGRVKYPEFKNGHHSQKPSDKNNAEHDPHRKDHKPHH
jgi:putative nucleotidyltransferase with HDIG domain